jgi:hypothetical protein
MVGLLLTLLLPEPSQRSMESVAEEDRWTAPAGETVANQ